MLDVPNWLSEVQNQGIPDSIEELEEAVARFDDLHAAFNTFYNEVCTQYTAICINSTTGVLLFVWYSNTATS